MTSNVMGLDSWQENRYREGTRRNAGNYVVSPTRYCPCCKKLRSVRQFAEGIPFCLSCRRPR